jgi:UDPglucose 6-dehydrogenase
MLKLVAYIGYGFVGKACHLAFEHNAEAVIIDPKYTTFTIKDLRKLKPQIVFVSINSPTLDDRTVDALSVYDIFRQLSDIECDSLVVLKSTLPPHVVYDLSLKFPDLKYIYSPEFLREKHLAHDALNPELLIFGGRWTDCRCLEVYYRRHSHVNIGEIRIVDYTTASLAKYAVNSFLAAKVVFMNQMQQLFSDTCNKDGRLDQEAWEEFVELLSLDSRIGKSHMDVPGPDGNYGYGGNCFPKDIKALIGFDKENRLTMMKEVELANTKIRLIGKTDSNA